MKLLQLLNVITEKSARDRYLQMFSQLYNKATHNGFPTYKPLEKPWATYDDIRKVPTGGNSQQPHTQDGETPASEIKWAVENLGREDRIIWYLRQAREVMMVMHNPMRISPNTAKMMQRTNRRNPNTVIEPEYKDIHPLMRPGVLRSLKRDLMHFLGLPIQKIQEYRFGWEKPEGIFTYFRQLEEKFQNEKKDGTPLQEEPDHDVFMRFADGTAWWNLNTAQCRQEADAMGHCGNADPNSGDLILSLRKPRPVGNKTWWVPHLTFIWNTKTGKLGEMKGRANAKPVAAYHKYIIALLKDARIKGITGGGYKPENNFRLSDLPQAEQDKLIDEKPELADMLHRYNKFGMTAELVKEAEKKLDEFSLGVEAYLPEIKAFLINTFKSADEFASSGYVKKDRDSRDGNLKYVLGHLGGEGWNDGRDFYEQVDEHSCEEILDQLTPKEMNAIGNHIAEEADLTEEELEEFDFERSSDLYEMIGQHDQGDLMVRLKQAAETGLRYGAEEEMVKYVDNYFRDLEVSRNSPYQNYFFLVNLNIERKEVKNEYSNTNAGYQKKVGFKAIDNDKLQHWEEFGLMVHEKSVMEMLNQDGLDSYGGWGEIAEFDDLDRPHYGFSGWDEKAAVEDFREAIGEILRAESKAEAEAAAKIAARKKRKPAVKKKAVKKQAKPA